MARPSRARQVRRPLQGLHRTGRIPGVGGGVQPGQGVPDAGPRPPGGPGGHGIRLQGDAHEVAGKGKLLVYGIPAKFYSEIKHESV